MAVSEKKKTVKLTRPSAGKKKDIERTFDKEHALRLLILQGKSGSWKIHDSEKLKFENNEIIAK